MHKFTLPIILSATLALAVITMISIPISATAGEQVGVCCAWNDKLADGELTYKVSGGTSEIRDAMIEAIDEWDTAITGLRLVDTAITGLELDTAITGLELEINEAKGDAKGENKGKGKAKADKADITVKFKKGGGVIAGQALRNFDKGTSFVKSVQINVSGKAFGNTNPAEIIKQVVKHEFGHALGLNHANFSDDLMSTTVEAGTNSISDCDIDGVIAANHWKLVENDTTPHTPHTLHVNHVDC